MSQKVTCQNGHSWHWSEKQPTCPKCGATEAITMTRFTETSLQTPIELTQPRIPGTAPLFPGYDVLEVLGAGGMGIVYKARQHAPSRIVALKTFHGVDASQEVRERFVAEANAVARLQHPNIIQIFEVGEHAGRRFLALEFVDGLTLSRILNRKPQPPALAAEVVERLARAIDHAHRAGILHRDLKPGNVLVPKANTRVANDELRFDYSHLKIADFGLAKDLAAPDGPTQLGDVLGTPSYMAPEQASGIQKSLTAAIDVYALGAILYEMLTGNPPFLGSSSAETVLQVLSKDPVPVRQLRPDCPLDLETICLKCLEKSPAKRYESATDLADDLHRYLTHQSILARPAGLAERLFKWGKRNPAYATLAVSAVVIGFSLVIAGVLYGMQLRRHNDRLKKLAESERQAHERATMNFRIAGETVTEMRDIAANDLSHVPNLDPTRRLILQKALNLQRQLLQQDVSNPATKNDVAIAARRAGEIYVLLGDLNAADEHFRQAAQLHRELAEQLPHDPEYRLEWAQDLNALASMLGDMAKNTEADEVFVQAGNLLERLTEQFPDDSNYSHQRGRILINHGRLLGRTNHPNQAEQAFRHARDRLAILAELHPDEPTYRERLAAAWINLGLVYGEFGRIRDSREAYDRGGKLLAKLVDDFPQNRNYRWTLAQMYTNQGNQLWRLNDRPAATLAYRYAFDGMQQLVQDFPGIPEYRNSMAHCLEHLGFVLFRSGHIRVDEPFWQQILAIDLSTIAEGAVLREKAIEEKQDLVAKYPNVTDYHASLAISYSNKALWHREHHEWKTAYELFDRTILSLRLALRPDPSVRRYQNLMRDSLWYQGEMAMHLGKFDEAISIAQSTTQIVPNDPVYFIYAAQITAQCASAAKEAEAAGRYVRVTAELVRQSAKIRLAQQHPTRTIALASGGAIVEVVRTSWPEAELVRTLPELRALMPRREFQDLLVELER